MREGESFSSSSSDEFISWSIFSRAWVSSVEIFVMGTCAKSWFGRDTMRASGSTATTCPRTFMPTTAR